MGSWKTCTGYYSRAHTHTYKYKMHNNNNNGHSLNNAVTVARTYWKLRFGYPGESLTHQQISGRRTHSCAHHIKQIVRLLAAATIYVYTTQSQFWIGKNSRSHSNGILTRLLSCLSSLYPWLFFYAKWKAMRLIFPTHDEFSSLFSTHTQTHRRKQFFSLLLAMQTDFEHRKTAELNEMWVW